MRRLTVFLLTASLLFAAVPSTTASAWTATQQCTKYEPTMATYAPAGGWNVNRMSYFAYRESRCTPWVVSTTDDHGLLQVNRINFKWLSAKFGVPLSQVATWLKNPTNNIRAAAALCTFWRKAGRSCYYPWS